MAKTTTVRWGVIGLGWFGEVHAEVLSRLPGVELAALCTRRAERLDELADRYGVARRYTDYRRLLADPEVDALSIVTHVEDHCQIAVEALAAGKHVLLEKPMAGSLADCDRIVAAARSSRGQFMVGHICRFDPRVAMAQEAVREGRIGQIISMHARRNLSKAIGRQVLDKISALLGDGIHDADLMLWFSQSRPLSVYAQEVHPGPNKYADAAWAMFRLESGAVGVVESIWHLPETTPYQIDARMEIIGTEGALYVNCGEAGLAIHDRQGVKMPDTVYWPKVFGQQSGVLGAELAYFTQCVREGRPPERITPEESRAAVALVLAAAESSRSGQVVDCAKFAG
jgi:UDP-N-acetylglucosamine 3-dehydrogenase